MFVLAPAPGTIVWSIGDVWELPAAPDGQGTDTPVFAGAPATCVLDGPGSQSQCTGGMGPVSFHVQRPDLSYPSAEYRNMMVVQKWDPVRNYAFDYALTPNGIYDARFQTVYQMKYDAQYARSLIWQDHSMTGNLLLSLGVTNPDNLAMQFASGGGGHTGSIGDPFPWYGPTAQGGVDTWEFQFRNSSDSTGWIDMYRNGMLQFHYSGPVVPSTAYDLTSFGIYYYDWQGTRSAAPVP